MPQRYPDALAERGRPSTRQAAAVLEAVVELADHAIEGVGSVQVEAVAEEEPARRLTAPQPRA